MSVFPTKILSAVCDISMGQAPKGDSYNATRRGFPLIAGAGDFGELTPAPKKYTDAPTKLSRPGDLILCIRATIGDRNWSDKEYCLGRGVAGLRAKDADLSQAYLGQWLDHVAPVLRTQGRGATFLQVSKSDIASLQIPLPPLDEQKRIAGILDAADALRAKRREALAQLDTLLQSTFIDLFGDPVTNPMGWEMVNGGRVSRRLTVGIVVKPACYYQPTGVPAIRSLNVRTNKIEIASLVYVSAENNEGRLKKTRIWKDDVLLVRSGQPGTAAVVPAELDGVNAIDILILTPDQHVAHPVYLSNYFNSAGGKRMVLSAQCGQIQKHLNVGSLRSAPIPLPPLDLQRRFATIVESVEQQKARQRAHLAELDTLFASLQSRAFRGDL